MAVARVIFLFIFRNTVYRFIYIKGVHRRRQPINALLCGTDFTLRVIGETSTYGYI